MRLVWSRFFCNFLLKQFKQNYLQESDISYDCERSAFYFPKLPTDQGRNICIVQICQSRIRIWHISGFYRISICNAVSTLMVGVSSELFHLYSNEFLFQKTETITLNLNFKRNMNAFHFMLIIFGAFSPVSHISISKGKASRDLRVMFCCTVHWAAE